MLDKIIQFSIKNKLIIGLFTLALIGWGSYSVTKLPIDAVPDITDNQVMIITVSPSLAAQEVEQLVTFPVEQTMVSIPGLKDMRSFSRFGLSIVTVIFNEDVELYWARQQIHQRLEQAAQKIPEGVGKPEMAPVTTGLGEIYQYSVIPEKGYEDQYSLTELRTIQDWIIKRQLLGTPGVAEVSGFGGNVKQYEIAVNPDKLRSMGVTISDIFTALEDNNQNTGGAYITKGPNIYFIRSEGRIDKLADLGKIVVKNTDDGIPILIRDVAKVQFGHAIRYGAATRNGNGEVVTGIVMMLKGANSSQVITNVRNKIDEIKKTLPEGVTIKPFLDRKKLVDRTTGTIIKNLSEGALIVIFVLILFLGNLRSGLIVASVIPLSMLFAIAMMNLFGVSGNLMSLGAIDFGLIVDGAVIIVEAVMHRIRDGSRFPGVAKLSTAQMDKEVKSSANKMMSAAAFGQIIILIVYIPILSLQGVSGKMFRPMAETVSFAILGALILSLTYVPMMSAFALSRKTKHKPNFSDRMMIFFHRVYRPIIDAAIHRKLLVVCSAIGLLIISIFVFNRLGGEFIPQLDEGDFAVETRLPVGSSIDQMIDVTKKAQTILLANYPEVEQVVNKIGSGEVPTDPMPIEAGDMMVILQPHSEWVSAETKDELIEKMQESLSVIPNASFSFQQPIQMRFNELLTGAKQDVVIKIYGEDLNTLSDLANDVGQKIKKVDGVEDLYIEQITGMPQIQIKFNRNKIAQYGMNVKDINNVIKTAFAGKSAGLVYEGERRFDLVVRLDKAHRNNISDVENLYVMTPDGQQIPLSEVANVSYEPGPVQIQRDNAKRRITIGFNVRNRDVKSIVGDIKQIVSSQVAFPAGYYATYGGKFKSLQQATERLTVAVPVALLLILLLLFFAFKSVKESLLIFSAIPLAAIGGVFALLVRGMPFSISAGVGFIALFGVAVLNGMVLISEFNRLAKEGVDDVYERVRRGTKVRLRPVLMTATVASLGFLPMAISTSAGAEVQRPLATVVIGGLITATMLTLVVLPVLYIYFTSGKIRLKRKTTQVVTIALLALGSLLASTATVQAQKINSEPPQELTLQQAIDIALKNNNRIKIANYDIALQKALKGGSVTIPKTDFTYTQGAVSNPTIDDNILNITQRINFPTLYSSKSKLAREKIESSKREKAIKENKLIADVKMAYLQYLYVIEKRKLLQHQDSIYGNLKKSSKLRYQTGESTKLESVTSATQAMQIRNKLEQNTADLDIAKTQLQTLLNTSDNIMVAESEMQPKLLEVPTDSNSIAENPLVLYLQQQLQVNKQQTKVEKNKWLPDIILGYSSQTYRGSFDLNGVNHNFTGGDRFSYFSIGLSIPIFPGGHRADVKAVKIKVDKTQSRIELTQTILQGKLQKLVQQYYKLKNTLNYYQNQALPQAELIISNSEKGFKSGNISYIQHFQNLTMAVNIQSEYLESLYQYNQLIISIESLLGK